MSSSQLTNIFQRGSNHQPVQDSSHFVYLLDGGVLKEFVIHLHITSDYTTKPFNLCAFEDVPRICRSIAHVNKSIHVNPHHANPAVDHSKSAIAGEIWDGLSMGLQTLCPSIWWFPEMGVPPVIIQFSGIVLINQPFWGTPHLGKPPYIPKLYHCWIESSTEYHFWFTTVTSESKQCRMAPHGSDTTARLSRLCSAAVTDKMMTRGADWRSGLSGWWMARYGK